MMTTTGWWKDLKVKVNQPRTVEGTGWEDLSKRFKNYLCLQEEDYETWLPWATPQTVSISEIELQTVVANLQNNNGWSAEIATNTFEKLKR